MTALSLLKFARFCSISVIAYEVFVYSRYERNARMYLYFTVMFRMAESRRKTNFAQNVDGSCYTYEQPVTAQWCVLQCGLQDRQI